MATDEGAKEIVSEISRRVREDVDKILGKAKIEAEEIIATAQNQAKQEEEVIIARGNHLARQEKQRITADARIKARRKKIEAEESLIQTVFREAKDVLSDLRKPSKKNEKDYILTLSDLIVDASIAVTDDVAEILFSKKDNKIFNKEFLSKLCKKLSKKKDKKFSLLLSKESIDTTIGGIIVRTKGGEIEVNNTFEARIKRLEDTMRPEVAGVLFRRES